MSDRNWGAYRKAARGGVIALAFLVVFAASNPPSPSAGEGERNPPPSHSKNEQSAASSDHEVAKPTMSPVQLFNAHNASDQATHNAKEGSQGSLADWWMVWLTGGLFATGVAQATLFLWQLRIIRGSIDDTKITAQAAADSAKAGLLQVEALIAAERAYMLVLPQMQWNGTHQVVAANAGKTPAFCNSCVVWPCDVLPDRREWVEPGMIFNEISSASQHNEHVVIVAINIPPGTKYLLGRLTYEDIFKRTRREWFRYDLAQDGFWRYSGGLRWNWTEELEREP